MMSRHAFLLPILPLVLLTVLILGIASPYTQSQPLGALPQSGQVDEGYTVIFEDGFDDGEVGHWSKPADWTATQEDGNWYLRAAPAGMSWLAPPIVQSAYRFRVDVRLWNGWATLGYRQSYGGYMLDVAPTGLNLSRYKGESGAHLANNDTAISTGHWHTVEISGTLGHIQVFVDGNLRIDRNDSTPWYAGSIGLHAFDSPTTHVDFDNVQVLVLLSDEPPWVQTGGPTGSPMNSIVVHPTDGNVLYASGTGGGVYKSTDAGETWVLKDIPGIGPSDRFHGLAIDPAVPDTLYTVAGNGIRKTIDGGNSWRTKNSGINPCHFNMYELAIDPVDSNTLYVGTYTHCPGTMPGALYKTTNGGDTWTVSGGLTMPAYGRISALDVHGSHVYVGVVDSTAWQGGKLFHSSDAGATWAEVDFGQPANTYIHSIFIDRTDGDEVWVGLNSIYGVPVNPVLFVTRDGGLNWQAVPNFPEWGGVLVLGKSPLGILFVNNRRTTDGGEHWETFFEHHQPDAQGTPADLAFDPLDENTLYLALLHGSGLVKSTNGGRTWYRINNGVVNTSVSLLAAHLSDPGTLYATATTGGMYKTTDYGATWDWQSGRGITHLLTDEVVVNPLNPETVWEVADTGMVFETTNGGMSWNNIISPYGGGFRFGSIYAIAPAPSDPDTIYALKNGFGLFKSTNGGRSWEFLHQSEVDYTYSIAVHPTDPDIVFSGYNPKPFQDWAMVRQTTDGGISWRTALSVPHASGITSVAIDPNEPDTVYAGSTGEGGVVWVSRDAGDTWANVNEHFNFTNIHFMTVDPGHPDVAYAGVWGGGTFKTTDGGRSWSRLPHDPTISASAILVHPTDPDVVYLADRTSPRIYRTTDGDVMARRGSLQTWETFFDAGAGYYRVMTAALAPGNPNVVYASVFTYGGPTAGHVFRIENGNATNVTGTLPRLPVALAVDPTDANTVFAVLHTKGVYKTTDGGQTWVDISGPGSGLPQSPHVGFNSLVIGPDDALYLIGGCDVDLDLSHTGADPDVMNTVYRSTDGGATWTNLNDGTLGTNSGSIKGLAISPADPDVLYVGALKGVFQSTDGGASWADISAGLGYTHTAGIALSSDGTHLHVPTLGGGVYAGDVNTTTHEVTWNGASNLTATIYHVQVAVDPSDSETLYASAYPGGTFKSVDGGLTWGECNFGMASFEIDDPNRQGYYAFAIAPSDPDVLYLGLYGVGMYKSTDGAGTWQPMNGSAQTMRGGPRLDGGLRLRGKHITSLLIDPSHADTVYVGTEDGIYQTTDGGTYWSDFSTGLDCPDVRVLAMGNDGTLYAGTRGYELYRYDDQNNTWRQMTDFGNFGTLWPIWDNRPMYPYTSLLFHPTDPDLIYFGAFPAGIYKSTDGGQSWRESNVGWANDGVFSLVFHPGNPDIIYAGTYNGVSRSTDGGAHWELWNEGWPDQQWVFSIAFDPRDPNVMYACSKNGENEGRGREGFRGTVMKSTDGGADWFEITTGLNVNQEFRKIIPWPHGVDQHTPDTLYLATESEGVFISRDGGELWLPWNEGLTNLMSGTDGNNVTNPMAQSADGFCLYFGTLGSGMFRRETPTFVRLDLDGGGTIDVADIMPMANRWHHTDEPLYDFDGDGRVTVADIMRVATQWGASCG